MDSVYYGTPIFTPANFLRTNLSSVSLFYGINPWHYYLSQALPILCTTALPFVFHGAWIAFKYPGSEDAPIKISLRCVLWTIGIYSMAGHKEWRFLHPLLPLLHIFAAKSLVDLHSSHSQQEFQQGTAKRNPTKRVHSIAGFLPIRTNHLFLLLIGIPLSIYAVVFYCDAPIGVMAYLRGLSSQELQGSVGFLMPCHSTPWQSHLHRRELADGKMWALGCEPPIGQVIPPMNGIWASDIRITEIKSYCITKIRRMYFMMRPWIISRDISRKE
jgi:phosphatidylinositol glycan class B